MYPFPTILLPFTWAQTSPWDLKPTVVFPSSWRWQHVAQRLQTCFGKKMGEITWPAFLIRAPHRLQHCNEEHHPVVWTMEKPLPQQLSKKLDEKYAHFTCTLTKRLQIWCANNVGAFLRTRGAFALLLWPWWTASSSATAATRSYVLHLPHLLFCAEYKCAFSSCMRKRVVSLLLPWDHPPSTQTIFSLLNPSFSEVSPSQAGCIETSSLPEIFISFSKELDGPSRARI